MSLTSVLLTLWLWKNKYNLLQYLNTLVRQIKVKSYCWCTIFCTTWNHIKTDKSERRMWHPRIQNWWRECMAKFTPLFNNLQPIFDNLSPNDPYFDNMSKFSFFFLKFLSNMCPNLYFMWKIGQYLYNSHHLIPFFGCLTNWPPFFGEKSLTERRLPLSCCPSIPVTSKVEYPPPGPGVVTSTWWGKISLFNLFHPCF